MKTLKLKPLEEHIWWCVEKGVYTDPDKSQLLSYFEKIQEELPEEYRISGDFERKTAINILRGFCKSLLHGYYYGFLKYRGRKITNEEYLFLESYNFFYGHGYRLPTVSEDIYTDESAVKNMGEEKEIISFLSDYGVVLCKIKLIICHYFRYHNSTGASPYDLNGKYDHLKDMIHNRCEKFKLSCDTAL